MVSHQAIGMDLPTSLLASVIQGAEEQLAVLVIKENQFAPVTMIHQVVDGAGKLNSQWPRHRGQFLQTTIESDQASYRLSIVRTDLNGS